MTTTNQPTQTYQEANAVHPHRTGSDWMNLRTRTCPGGPVRYFDGDPTARCGQRFKAEVIGQTQCRDCHALAGTGFYEVQPCLNCGNHPQYCGCPSGTRRVPMPAVAGPQEVK